MEDIFHHLEKGGGSRLKLTAESSLTRQENRLTLNIGCPSAEVCGGKVSTISEQNFRPSLLLRSQHTHTRRYFKILLEKINVRKKVSGTELRPALLSSLKPFTKCYFLGEDGIPGQRAPSLSVRNPFHPRCLML